MWNGYSEKGQGSEERGPGTFTFAPPATPQAQGSNAVMARAGYSTTPSVGGLTQYDASDKTADALFGFAQAAFEPMIKEAASRNFLKGMQQAASGEALTDIINNQPWYTKIFGAAAAVEGARQYSLDAQAAKFDSAVQTAMPSLKNTSPDELPNIIMEIGKQFSTGDAATDMQLGLRITKVLPNIMQAHTREFYKAQQENAVTQRYDAAIQNAESLQIVSQDPMASQDDQQLRQATFLQGFMLPQGMDENSHHKFVDEALTGLATSGKFHAVKTALDGGVLSLLPPDKRQSVQIKINHAKAVAARDAMDNYTDRLVEIQLKAASNKFGSPKEVMDAFNAINDDYAKLSGNDEPLIHRAMQSSTVMTARQAYMTYQREIGKTVMAERDVTMRAELANKALGVMTYNKAVDAVTAAGGKESVVADVARQQWLALSNDPKAQAAWLIRTSYDGSKVSSIKDDINERIGKATDSKDANFLYGYNLYRELVTQHPADGGPNNAIAAYMNPKDIKRYAAFHDALGGQSIADAGERAFALSREAFVNPGYKFNKDEDKAWAEFVDGPIRGNSFIMGSATSLTGNEVGYFMAPAPLSDTSTMMIKSMVQSNWQAAKALDPHDPHKAAIAIAKQQGLEMFGSYAWVNGRGRKPLERILAHPLSGFPMTTPMIANGLNSFVEEKKKALTNSTVKDVFLQREADAPDGTPMFVLSMHGDGQWIPETMFSGKDLVQHITGLNAAPAKAKLLDFTAADRLPTLRSMR